MSTVNFSSKSVLIRYCSRIPNEINIIKHRLAAKTHFAVAEFLLVSTNKEWFLNLHKGTLIPVASKRDGQHFRPE